MTPDRCTHQTFRAAGGGPTASAASSSPAPNTMKPPGTNASTLP